MTQVIRTSGVAEAGLTVDELRGPEWRPRSHGLYVRSTRDDDLGTRCRDVLHVLPPDSAYSHLTAAQLHGLWLPRLPEWLPLQATLAPKAIRPERRGLWVARTRARHQPVEQVEDVPVVATPVVLGQLAEDLGLIDLVVAIDSALHLGRCTAGEVGRCVRTRQRGAPMLRLALSYVDARSESPWETVLRLFHVLCGFADIEPQAEICDEAGRFVARADLLLGGTRRIHEYDGAHHRSGPQHVEDLRRDKALARAGYERYGYTRRDLVANPAAVLRDVEAAYGLRHDLTRLSDWTGHAQRATISADGWNRFLHRLHRFGGSGGRKTSRHRELRENRPEIDRSSPGFTQLRAGGGDEIS